jgi:predicted Zn-dependent protease
MFKQAVICSVVGFIISCAPSPTFVINPPTTEEPKRVVPVAIDVSFTQAEKQELYKAIEDWNFALNGQMTLKVYTQNFDMEDTTIEYIYNANGVMLLKVSKVGSPMLSIDENTLAITSHIGVGHEIYFIKDRANVERLRLIADHEIAHVLGAHHSNNGLMQPEFNRYQYSCIDYNAISQVAEYQHLNIERMNWCVK